MKSVLWPKVLSATIVCVIGSLVNSGMVLAQQIVAHRGASYDAPENTLAAFQLAFEQGADGIEGDFYVTVDQQIVCIHDKDTRRVSSQQLVVAHSTADQLRALDVGSWKDPKFASQRIPTFDEVLAAVPEGKLFVIELKTGPEIVPLLKAKLENADIKERKFLIIAFDTETVIACKSLLPHLHVHWLTSFEQKDGTWAPSVENIIQTVRRTKADGVGMQGKRQVIDANFVSKLKNAGIDEFHFWTIDNLDDANFFRSLGAYGITTNRPGFIREHLPKN